MNRFAFIVHPIEIADIARKYPIAAKLPPRLVEWGTAQFVKPKVVSHITGIRSRLDGSEVEGLFVACPLTTRQLLEWPAERTVPIIIECARIAEAEGAGIVGLGAMTSVAGDAGVTVSQNVGIAVTTGNSYTVASAMQGVRRAAQLMGLPLAQARAAVLGATGSIGRVCAEMLADEADSLVLLVRDHERGQQLASELRNGGPAEVSVDSDLAAVLPDCDILVCVSAAKDALVEPRHLKSGAVVCDVARPRDVSIAVAHQRDDVLVIEGGVVKPPGDHVDFGMDFGFPPGLSYACMAETALLGLVGRYECYSLGRELSRAKVEEIAALADQHGFELAGFRSFERAFTDADIEALRQRVAARSAG